VLSRLRSARAGLGDTITVTEHRDAVMREFDHLNLGVERSGFDDQDQTVALQEDRQQFGVHRNTKSTRIDATTERMVP
jgi:hypothetical protein